MDNLDLAAQNQQRATDQALSNVQKPPAFTGCSECIECEGEISPGRVQLGYQTCILCQSDIEALERISK